MKVIPNKGTPKPSTLKGKVSSLTSRFEQGFKNSSDSHVSLSDSNPVKTTGNTSNRHIRLHKLRKMDN